MNIDPARKEIIEIFMEEAKQQDEIKSGFNQTYKEVIGLVDVIISFEAFINELMPSEKEIWKKRKNFSSKYQSTFEKNKKVFDLEIKNIKKELDKGAGLPNMTPNSRSTPLKINNPNDLSKIIEVVYRVRSNLIHGSKSLESARNKLLIGDSFRFLFKLLGIIFKDEGII